MLSLIGFLRVPIPAKPLHRPRPRGRPRPWSSRQWCDYFHRQWHHLLIIPWRSGAGLTPSERDLIAPSLRVFQQGEAQEGGHFYRCARAHAQASGDFEYAEAHRLFMGEEKRHGRDLGRFLTLAGAPPLAELSRLTRAFCWCGSRGGLESTLLVILLSEVLALVYYAALGRATGSPVLHRLCAQILRDEKMHVRFQAESLARLRRRRWRPLLALSNALDAVLFVAAAWAVWLGHRRVLRAGGLGFGAFCRQASQAYRSVARLKNPRSYQSL
jgi:hypothetical protein